MLDRKSYLNECLRYVEGCLIWKRRPASHFLKECDGVVWNKRFSNKPAGGPFRCKGAIKYMQVRIDNNQELAHRVVWEMHNGIIPEGMMIDHINGNGLDNRLENIRLVNNSGNQRNSALYRRNKSGIHGVDYMERIDRWRAQAYDKKGQRIYLGAHKTLLDAAAARKAAEIRYGYHENHGRVQERLKANQS